MPIVEKFTFETSQTFRISNEPITAIAYNAKNDVLATCTEDGRVLLAKLENIYDQKNTSSVQLSDQRINRVLWLKDSQFLLATQDGHIHIFDILRLENTRNLLHSSSIYNVEFQDNTIYTASLDGNIGIFDSRIGKQVATIEHLIRKAVQPVKDLQIREQYLYSTTAHRGILWLWDIRNVQKPHTLSKGDCSHRRSAECKNINKVATDKFISSIKMINSNIYCLGSGSISKFSESLNLSEIICKFESDSFYNFGKIDFLERFGSKIYSTRDSIHLEDKLSRKVQNLSGFEIIDSDQLLLFTSDGNIILEQVCIKQSFIDA
jgi:WD40 repeat protein